MASVTAARQTSGGAVLITASGLILLGWAIASPNFRDIEGFPTPALVLPVAFAVGLVVLGLLWRGPLRRSAAWFVLGLVSQAAALQLVEAGPFVRYQHLLPGHSFSPHVHLLPIAILALQAVCVSLALWAYGRCGLRAVGRRLLQSTNGKRAIPAALLFIGSSAVLSRSILTYGAELAAATAFQLLALGNLAAVLLALPDHRRSRLTAAAGNMLERPSSSPVDRFSLLAALWVVAIASGLAILVWERHPHIPDEIVYLLEARHLAEGDIALTAPPVREAFDIDIMAYSGDRWYSPAPFGWPAILAVAVKGGFTWLLNPLLAGAAIILAYGLLHDLYDRRTARLAVLLLAVSPWLLFLSMSLLNHASTLALALLSAMAAARYWRTGKLWWVPLSGAALGAVSLVRPLDALALGCVIALAWLLGKPARRSLSFALFAGSAIAVASVVLPYNQALTGSAFEFPLTSYAPDGYEAGANALGFGPNRGLGWTGLDPLPGHGPLDVAINGALNISLINIELFGWSTGSLVLLLALLLFARMNGADRVMVATIGAVVVAYSLYWFHGGPDFGARYWYLVIVPCAALSARGLFALGRILWPVERERAGSPAFTPLLLGVVVLSFWALSTFLPWRALDKYRHYRGMRPDVRTLAQQYGFSRSLVLVRGDRHPDYASAVTYNPLDLRADAPIYAWDRDPEIRARVLAAYSDRPVWIIDGPSITGRGYVVRDGPLWPRSHDN